MGPEFILIIVALGAFIVFQTFQGRKRRRETENRQAKFLPGVEIMTNYGVYGTILSLDDETNLALIETTPGTVLKIHRQTILKLADYAPVVDEDDADAVVLSDDATSADTADDAHRELDTTGDGGRPEFGERVDGGAASTENPATRRGAKKIEE